MLHSSPKRAISWLQALLTKAFEFGMCKHSVRLAIASFNLTFLGQRASLQDAGVHVPTACAFYFGIHTSRSLDIECNLSSSLHPNVQDWFMDT